jgi:hypothetical protein
VPAHRHVAPGARSDDQLEGATRTQAGAILLVVVIIAVIPWRQVLDQYVMAPGEPWRRSR